jgi:hypothetical protein
MLRVTFFNVFGIKDIIHQVGPGCKGSFSFISPLGSRITVWMRDNDPTYMRAEEFCALATKWSWY